MPAKIVVKSGAAAKTVFSIEEDLLRIGSDPSCDLVLPDAGLAPHAATLEFLEGKYIVYNRSDGVLRMNSGPIPVRGSKQWITGQDLHLTDQVVLRLEADAVNPAPPAERERTTTVAPVKLPDKLDKDKETGAPLSVAEEGEKRQKQYIILGLLGAIALVIMILPAPVDKPRDLIKPHQAFADLIHEFDDKSKTPEEVRNSLISTRFILQEARIAELRGDTEASRALYGQVLETLIGRRNENGTFPTHLEQRMWDFVTNQMRQ